jgi:hypothetical protein
MDITFSLDISLISSLKKIQNKKAIIKAEREAELAAAGVAGSLSHRFSHQHRAGTTAKLFQAMIQMFFSRQTFC